MFHAKQLKWYKTSKLSKSLHEEGLGFLNLATTWDPADMPSTHWESFETIFFF